MSKAFYLKMAWQNLVKNKKVYIPFLLTSVFATMMLYMIVGLASNKGLKALPGGQDMQMMLGLGVFVVEMFLLIFLFYTNSFLLKRRKKEFGLYSVLGMEKKHLARVIFYELLFCFAISLTGGLLAGMLLDKLLFLVVIKMLGTEVPLGFSISVKGIQETVLYVGIVYVAMFVYALLQVRLANPIELLHSGSMAEKEPKSKLVITILGIVLLATGYAISLTITNPIMAMLLFFVAVICVIIGTYLLFTSGSITLLKALEKNKRYYYKIDHFLSVSNMKFRMKQNAVSLGNICILSTMVLVMLSTTISLWTGMVAAVESGIGHDYNVTVRYDAMDENPDIAARMDAFVKDSGIHPTRQTGYSVFEIPMEKEGNRLDDVSFGQDAVYADFIALDDYNALENTDVKLGPDEVLVYGMREKYGFDSMHLLGTEYKAKELDSFSENNPNDAIVNNTYLIVVPSREALLRVKDEATAAARQVYPDYTTSFQYRTGLDSENKDIPSNDLMKGLANAFEGATISSYYAQSKVETFQQMRALYAGFLFIGVFLSLLFIMATILIMYYKQISEGYEDQKRYDIMKKVGLDEKQVKKTIRTQVITVFFLPLIVAGVHICFAFPIISKLLRLLLLSDMKVFVLTTLAYFLIFSVLYILIYWITARAYYKIVSSCE